MKVSPFAAIAAGLARVLIAAASVSASAAPAVAAGDSASGAPDTSPLATQTETLVFLRHGEKPPGGLGQINCQGMNRALRLPGVLQKKFGSPDFIFAPDPALKTQDPQGEFDYVRPLATIEPTAVATGLPVNTDFGFRQIDQLRTELLKPRYRDAMVFIAWEHSKARELAVELSLADGASVPRWESSDFDSLFIVRIRSEGEQRHASFQHDQEGLDGLPETCSFAP